VFGQPKPARISSKAPALRLTVDQLNIPVAEVRPGGQDALPGSEFKSAGADDPEAAAPSIGVNSLQWLDA